MNSITKRLVALLLVLAMACVALAGCGAPADDAADDAAAGGSAAGKKSESNDGYSVTYVTEAQDGQTAEEALRKKIYEAIRLYLLPTGWLSRKVKMGGCCHECAEGHNSL